MLQGKFAKQIPTQEMDHSQNKISATTSLVNGVKPEGFKYSNFDQYIPSNLVCKLCLEPFITPMSL